MKLSTPVLVPAIITGIAIASTFGWYNGTINGEHLVCENTCRALEYPYFKVLADNSCDCLDSVIRLPQGGSGNATN